MKYSKIFGKTVKSVPADAVAVSHKYLWQGGFIRRFSTGRYGFLPLGYRVWLKIYRIIQEEMDKIGCQQLVVPTLHPVEVWKKTSRDEAFGEEMLVVADHYGNEFILGATAEGMMVELVKMFSPSYKDLPIDIYEFSSKFRDDKRPRGGILRVREFMMKDAYNFCANEKQLQKGYEKYFQSYLRIAKKLELAVIPVEADSGAIGGSLSHEFLMEGDFGDQTFFVCEKCGYAANIEKAEFYREPLNLQEKEKTFKIIDQPEWVCTMADNQKHYKEPPWRYLKNVVYKDKKGKIIIASVRGDQEVNEIKLKRALGLDSLEPATDRDLKKIGTKPGHVHSWGIKGAVYIGDLGLKAVKNFIGGQKEKKTDSVNVNYGRDFKYDLLADIVDAKAGDKCAFCKGKLVEKKGVEWGHTFKIDRFYTKKQEGYFTNKKGEQKYLWMGSYGIGIDRSLATIVEAHHDNRGIIWPESVAPFKYHLIGLDLHEKEVKDRAERVYENLVQKGEEVLYDDRENISAGEKFADADLIGIPYRLVISKKTKEKIEVKKRAQKTSKLTSLSQI
ncbi:MAG: proline--tRNA ligase [Candidatus Shapirobacteria bacterium]